ncbi:MAG: hypothetical protein EBZ24_10095 [Synechococcaceae bacterium WB9_4xB_025]|nr:hypothetical protein [Synechococcaceae bacterium WB9_4xB_025]
MLRCRWRWPQEGQQQQRPKPSSAPTFHHHPLRAAWLKSLGQSARKHNKARDQGPGRLSAQLICPRIGASVAIVMLMNNLDPAIEV